MSYKENISEFKENLARANKECQGVEPTTKKTKSLGPGEITYGEPHKTIFNICLLSWLFSPKPLHQ